MTVSLRFVAEKVFIFDVRAHQGERRPRFDYGRVTFVKYFSMMLPLPSSETDSAAKC